MLKSNEKINEGEKVGPFPGWFVEDLQQAFGLVVTAGYGHSPLGVIDRGACEGSGDGGGCGGRHKQRGRGTDWCRGGSAYSCRSRIPVTVGVQDI